MTSPQTVTKRKFKIKTLSDNVYDFQVDENMKVSDVKVLIAEKTGVPAQRQRLVFMAKLLENQKTIGSYVTEDDKTVHLMAKIVESDNNNNQTQSQPQQQQQQAQQQQQQQQNNPMAGLLGNFSGLLGFNPMQMIQQIASQPQGGVFNIMRSAGPGGLQMGQSVQGFGGLNNSGQGQSANNNPTQANQQPVQQQSQTSQQSQQNQSPPHQHHHHHHHPPPNVGTLPFNLLQNLGLSLNQTMGPGATFPGPPLPPIQNRNNVQILGAYLSQWHFQMTRLLPYINRLAELLQREPLMNNTNDRALTQQMVNRIPHLFETVANSTRAVIPVYSNLRLGNSVGQFTLGNNQNNPNQQQQQQQSNASNTNTNSNIGNNNPFGIIGQPVVSVQVLSNEQLPANLSSNISSLFGNLGNSNNNNNPQGNAPGSQQAGQNAFMNNFSSSLNDILPNLQGLIGSFMPGFVGSPPQPQTQPQSQSQPQPQSQNAPQSSPPTVSQQSNPNPVNPQQSSSTPVSQPPISSPSSQPQPQLPSQNPPVSAPVSANPMQALNNFMSNSNLSSMLTPENINLATSSNLRYMISEGHAISTQDESIYSLIFGDITGGQLIQLFTSSNYSFFDNRRADFRRGLLTSLSRYQNSTEKLIEKIVSDILPLLVSSELLQASVEGFDPELVARQILTDHLKKIIELILDNQEDFSGRLVKQIKGMIGELIYELQEGSSGNDVRFIIECIKKSGARVMDPYLMGMSGLVFMLFDKGMYGAYQDVKQAKEKSMKMTEDDHEKERQLLERIQKYAEEDRKELEKFVKEERSQYFK